MSRPITVGGRPWRRGQGVLPADGAWGSELIARGLAPGDAPEEWNLSRHADVLGVARSYREAGSVVVETNSFGAGRRQLARHGLAGRVQEINRLAAEITAAAVGSEGVVAGSMGPSGELLVTGETDEAKLYELFAEQARALAEGGANWIAVETMGDVAEMSVAVRAAVQATSLPVSASMTYEPGAGGFRTMMGNEPSQCVRAAVAAGASIIGANCGKGISYYPELTRTLRSLTDLPLWIYPNAGIPVVRAGTVSYPLGPQEFAARMQDVLEAGADIVGGCCGTTPAHIAAMAASLGDRSRAGSNSPDPE